MGGGSTDSTDCFSSRLKIKCTVIIFLFIGCIIGLLIPRSISKTTILTAVQVSNTIIKKNGNDENENDNENDNDNDNDGGDDYGNIYKDLKPYTKIYGHLHFPKTAGSNLNGLMASKYERVCGNKGFSYDSYQFNSRLNKSLDETETEEEYNKNKNGNNNKKNNNNIIKVGSAKGDMVSIANEVLTNNTGADRGKIPWRCKLKKIH
jgi:hypothetical protein